MLSLNVERCSTFTLTSDLSCIASILFANVTFTHVRTLKLRDIGYQPLTRGLSSKQQLRRWIPKKRIRAASDFIALIPSCSICQILANFLELNYKDCTKVQEKKKKVVVLFPSSTKREIRPFHVVGRAVTAKKGTTTPLSFLKLPIYFKILLKLVKKSQNKTLSNL